MSRQIKFVNIQVIPISDQKYCHPSLYYYFLYKAVYFKKSRLDRQAGDECDECDECIRDNTIIYNWVNSSTFCSMSVQFLFN